MPSPVTDSTEPNAIAVFTAELWLVCVVIGGLGFIFPYVRPTPPAPLETPIMAQQLQVELAQKSTPPSSQEAPPPDPLAPPPLPDRIALPPMPQPIAVVQPTPAVAFAQPAEGPTGIVEARRADSIAPPATNRQVVANPPGPAAPAVEQLTFGEGEGRQPAPEYPRSAVRRGEEGVVVVRLTVGENGRVNAAEVVTPSPWLSLNQAALRAVRETWRFRFGPGRLYEVAIRFELTK